MPEFTGVQWVFTAVAIIILTLYILVRLWIDDLPEPTEEYRFPDLPNDDREEAFDQMTRDWEQGETSFDHAVEEGSIDSLGDEPIDELDDSEGGTDDDDMNIDDLPSL